MSGGYTDDGWQGGGGPCPACGRELDDYGTCVCVGKRMTFDAFLSRCVSDCINASHEEGSDE